MREIKFRAWDTEKSAWYEPLHRAYEGQLWELMIGFGGDLLAHTMGGVEHQSRWPDRYKLMQYTGLKDKNGKGIYEGDVLEYDFLPEGKDQLAEVVFKEGRFCITDGHNYMPFKEKRKVIGNIYENPELLK
jgi:uncharacterized phage protein (TIGR01671 family)